MVLIPVTDIHIYLLFVLIYKTGNMLLKKVGRVVPVSGFCNNENINRRHNSANLITNSLFWLQVKGISVFIMFPWKNNNKMREAI
jgi:hypothetical protein